MGIILAMYQVARLLLSTTIGATMNRVGKKNYMMIGFCFFIVASIGFASLGYLNTSNHDDVKVENDILFLVGAISLNFIQGMGGACLQVASYSVILTSYASKRETGLAYLSAARGFGFFLGPLSG